MFHLISGVSVFLVDVITIFTTTAKLRTFQSNRADEDEKDEKANDGKKEKEKEKDEEEEEGAEDYDEHRPVKHEDRILAFLTLVCHGMFTLDLIIIAATEQLNSGTVLSCIVIGLLFLGWLAYTIKCWKLQEVSESWLLNLRLLTILHLFALLLFFLDLFMYCFIIIC